ncbi:GNAT family N-acetyltransferase [Massilia sp. UMI-21]|nr:GNAT family N-acetyltransferase [Massilia sp. UMI-21]
MRPDDLEAVLDVQAACYPPAMQEAGAVIQARLRAASASCAVVEDDAGVCAYLFAYPGRLGNVTALGAEFAPSPGADVLYLHDLAVAPRALGRGIGRALVAYLLDAARSRGLGASALVSVQDSAGFWEALGYRRVEPDCAQARAALASYPGGAHYMVRAG